MGLLLAVVVHAANIQDRDGADLVLAAELREKYPRMELLFADSGYSGTCERRIEERLGWRVEVVRRVNGVWSDTGKVPVTKPKGFQVLRWRWIVERTLAWLNRYRRLSKDYEQRLASSRTWILIAMSSLMLRRLR
jgi:putative transposase